MVSGQRNLIKWKDFYKPVFEEVWKNRKKRLLYESLLTRLDVGRVTPTKPPVLNMDNKKSRWKVRIKDICNSQISLIL